MKLVIMYYESSLEALKNGADVEKLAALPVREAIGRFKYIHEGEIDAHFTEICDRLNKEIKEACESKEDL